MPEGRRILDAHALAALSRDGWLLMATRTLRLFGYGLISVILVLYLNQLHFSEGKIGALLALTLLGDTVISLWITTRADRIGRRKMLVAGAALMLLAGGVFLLTDNFWLLLAAATIGVISPSGNEVGPFLAIEQAAIAHVAPAERRTGIFAWYNLSGSVATATGALVAGHGAQLLQSQGMAVVASYRIILAGYAGIGAVLALVFPLVSRAVEINHAERRTVAGMFLGLHKSKGIVFRLSALFSLDAFAGGFVIQSLVAYWFRIHFHTSDATIGNIFFGANVFAGISALSASWMASKIGLLNTMVYTHIPSNVLLILVPLMPNETLAIVMLLARFSISQMDVPTRQAYTVAVVDPDERSAAAGITGVARSLGAAASQEIATSLLGAAGPLVSAPFYIAGGLKIVYDLLIWRSFRQVRPDTERARVQSRAS